MKKKCFEVISKKIISLFLVLIMALGQSKNVYAKGDETSLPSTDQIHGIYVSAYVAGTKNMMEEMITHIDGSDINAVVIDVKNDEGKIVFDMKSDLIDELGAKNILVKDMPWL